MGTVVEVVDLAQPEVDAASVQIPIVEEVTLLVQVDGYTHQQSAKIEAPMKLPLPPYQWPKFQAYPMTNGSPF